MIKLLHVEDDADIRDITQLALEISGEFELLQCSSGKEALDRIEDYEPEIVLIDMMMPGLNGRETVEHIRKLSAFEKLPAIFMTARAQPLEMEEFRGIGNAEVITKPFDPMTLAEQIKDAIAKIS